MEYLIEQFVPKYVDQLVFISFIIRPNNLDNNMKNSMNVKKQFVRNWPTVRYSFIYSQTPKIASKTGKNRWESLILNTILL